MGEKKTVIIAGAGFGGLQAVKKLMNDKRFEIIWIDRNNHHLFQPLLYQIASAVLSPADIAIPARLITRNRKNVTVIMDAITGINKKEKEVILGDRKLHYDYLILALGARTGYFGKNEWMQYTSGLKSLNDALNIRRKLLLSFEEAENDPGSAGELLNYVVVGGGPTGVELAGSIAELSHKIIRNDFRGIDTSKARITLIEAGTDLLASFDRTLSVYAKEALEKRGVSVMLNTRVQSISGHSLVLRSPDGERSMKANIIIWAAGVEAVPLTSELNEDLDRQKRVIVNQFCSLDDHPEIFIIGDMAACKDERGKFLPGVGPVAMQQGRYAARMIRRELDGKPREVFRYFDKGNMATIGRKDAVAEFKGLKMRGFAGWLAWLTVHLFYQVGFKNKLDILITWIWSYITFGAGARVITDPPSEPDKNK
jgi:NADH dehydrogenase